MYNVHVGFRFSCLKFFMFFYFYHALEPMFKQQLFYNRIHISEQKKKKDTDDCRQGLWSSRFLQSLFCFQDCHIDKLISFIKWNNCIYNNFLSLIWFNIPSYVGELDQFKCLTKIKIQII